MNEVVLGNLQGSPRRIKTKEQGFKQIGEWDFRAMWSWARLQHGRSVDGRIREHMDMIATMKGKPLTRTERLTQMKLLFGDLVKEVPAEEARKLQFIFEDNRVIAVASLKHLLIPPQEVYQMAKKILSRNFGQPKLLTIAQLDGQTYAVKHDAGFQIGLQIYGGCITTRRAITLTSWCRVQKCLNTLSWLGSGGFDRFGIGSSSGDYERLLRIKVKSDLEPRLRAAIKQSLSNTGSLEKKVEAAKKTPVTLQEARFLVSAFGLSYGLGARLINQIFKRLLKEPETLWGMSMAVSWVAAHGKLRKTPKNVTREVEQRLSTIAGAAILIDDKPLVLEKSIAWLHTHAPNAYHIKNGKLVKGEGSLK